MYINRMFKTFFSETAKDLENICEITRDQDVQDPPENTGL